MRALILDFDGLILDTESAVFEAWVHVYDSFDEPFERHKWLAMIGTDSNFDPMDRLRELAGPELDTEDLLARRRRWRDDFLAKLEPMPGVCDLLEAAPDLGLRMAVASSSDRDWVVNHLRRLGLDHHFEAVLTRDDVDRAKPHPDLYLSALAALGASADHAFAIDDSYNGVAAARAAGMHCVAVPGPMTLEMDFSHASLVVESLAHHPLPSLLERVAALPG